MKVADTHWTIRMHMDAGDLNVYRKCKYVEKPCICMGSVLIVLGVLMIILLHNKIAEKPDIDHATI